MRAAIIFIIVGFIAITTTLGLVRLTVNYGATCISQNIKRLIKKYKKYTKSVFSESDKVETPSTYYYNLRKNRAEGFYHQNTNTFSVDDRLGMGNKFVAEIKNYIQYHPLFLQIGMDIEKYDVVSWDGGFYGNELNTKR